MKDCRVYALIDPMYDSIKYIGQTTKDLSQRLSKHIYDAKRENKTKVHKWIKNLLSIGMEPSILLVKENAIWNKSEIFYINRFKETGIELLNMTEGGDGLVGLIRTQEHKNKISKANTGKIRSEECKLQKSIALKGRKLTQKWKDKISLALKGKPKAPEHNKKVGDAHRGKPKYMKLSREQIVEIRSRYKNEKTSYRKLAREYNVNKATIGYALKRNIE